MKLQKAVKDEAIKVAIGEAIGVAGMFIIWFLIHLANPEGIPFDYKVILGGIVGGAVAVGNFIMLGLSVQKVTAMEEKDEQTKFFKSTYRKRMLIQIIWGILGFVLPCFNGIAGVIPLLFPTLTIRIVGAIDAIKGLKKKNPDNKESDERR